MEHSRFNKPYSDVITKTIRKQQCVSHHVTLEYSRTFLGISRFGKSTHISMISNCYTSAELYQLCNHRYCWKLRADIAGNSARAPISLHWVPLSPHRVYISSHRMASVRMFCDVSPCFKSVSQCFKSFSWSFTSGSWCLMTFQDVSQCFTSVSWCFTMFNIFQCLVSHATIGIAASATARATDRLRDRDTTGIDDNSAEIGKDTAGIVDIAAKVIPC